MPKVAEEQTRADTSGHGQQIAVPSSCEMEEVGQCQDNDNLMDLLMEDLHTSEGGSFDGRADADALWMMAMDDPPLELFPEMPQPLASRGSLDSPSMNGKMIAAAAASAATMAAAMAKAEDEERRSSPRMIAFGVGSPRQPQLRPAHSRGAVEGGAGVVTTGFSRLKDAGASSGGDFSSPIRLPPTSPAGAVQLSSTKGSRPPPGDMMHPQHQHQAGRQQQYSNPPTPTRSSCGGGSNATASSPHRQMKNGPLHPHLMHRSGGSHPLPSGPVCPMPVQSFYGGPMPARSGPPPPANFPPWPSQSCFSNRQMQQAVGEDMAMAEASHQEVMERRSASGNNFFPARSGGSGSTLSMATKRPHQTVSGGGMQRSHSQQRVSRSQDCATMAEIMGQFREDDGVVDGQPASFPGYPQAHPQHPFFGHHMMQRPAR